MKANGHDRWSEDVAAYVLGALEPERAVELESHAEACERCRREMRWLQPAVAAIAEAAPRREPPPQLRERLLAEVRAEARAAGVEPEPRSGIGAAWRRLGGWLRAPGPGARWRPLAAGLAVLVLLAAGVVGYEVGNSGGGGGGGPWVGAEGAITAEVVRQGGGAELNLAHVAKLPPDRVLEAWVRREGAVEPVKALFVPDRDGNASTMIVDMSGVEVVMVTREPAGGTSEPTGEPLVEVPISG
jgi:anti-sigma-K factor RskA